MTGETQIAFVVVAFVLPRNDVIDVKTRERQLILLAMAVFTPVCGALTDKPAKCCVDGHRTSMRTAGRGDNPCLGLKHTQKIDHANPGFVLCPFLIRERSRAGFVSQFIDPQLHRWSRTHSRDSPRHIYSEALREWIKDLIEDF